MRVLFFESGSYGGSIVCLHQLLCGLARRGVEVGFASYYRPTGPSDLFSLGCVRKAYSLDLPIGSPRPEVGERTLGVPHPTAFGVRYLARAVLWMLEYRPDVVYSNSGIVGHLPAILAARLLRIPVIAHLRIVGKLTPVERRCLHMVDRFITLTKAGLRFHQDDGIPPEKLSQVYDPFCVKAFAEKARNKLELPLPLNTHATYVVLVGALSRRKRPELAVDALDLARRVCPDLQLLLVGDGPMRGEVEDMIRRRGLQKAVHLVGNCTQVPALLNRCHIGLCVSRREGLGLCILEFMAAGLPVVTWNMPVFEELVEDGTTGLIVRETTAEAFAAALIRLHQSPDLRHKMGDAGRIRVADGRFDPDRHMEQVIAILRTVTSR